MSEQAAEQPGMFIANEVAFLQTLGINPQLVKSGSVKTAFDAQGRPSVEFTVIQTVKPRLLGMAFLAASPAEDEPKAPVGEQHPELPDMPPPPPVEADNVTEMKPKTRAVKRAAAKKTAAKKVSEPEALKE